VDPDRFQVLAGNACNNNCLFCLERDGAEGAVPDFKMTPERMWRVLAEHPGRDDVMFTTGEPTLSPNLAAYVGWARDLGYGRIGVTTNGRRLGYEAYTRSLLDRGLNHFVLSIHGPDAKTHDGLTRVRGSFDQVLAGLRLLARLKPEYGLSLHTSTVVTTRNCHRFPEQYELFRGLAVDQVIFNLLQPLGRAACLLDHIAPRYGETVQEFRRLVEAVGADPRPPLFFVDLPLCVSEGLPNRMRGWLEVATFIQYDDDGAPEHRTTRTHKEQVHRIKRAECASCRYDPHCLGVWRNYVEAFGWDEMVPVPGPPLAGLSELRERNLT
jgi:MoaA/NifB/PqqE/SkfB family radical SAM enzyme